MRKRLAHLCDDRREIGGSHLRHVDADRQRHAATLEAREGVDDRVAGLFPVEHLAGPRRQHHGPQSAKDDRRLVVRTVHDLRHPVELEGERPLEHAGRRRDVRAEDTHTEPAEAADRADAVALVERELGGGVPVRLDAETHRPQRPVVPARGEGDRHLRQRVGAALELGAGLARGQPAHVDAVDLHSGGDPARGAGEDEAEHGTAHRRGDRQHHQPLNEQRPGTAATPAADPDRASPCLDAQGAKSSGAIRR
jgi:hypothetical protein